MTDYEKGQWDMFALITSAEYGKERFTLHTIKGFKKQVAHDREDDEYMSIEAAYDKFFDEVEAIWRGI